MKYFEFLGHLNRHGLAPFEPELRPSRSSFPSVSGRVRTGGGSAIRDKAQRRRLDVARDKEATDHRVLLVLLPMRIGKVANPTLNQPRIERTDRATQMDQAFRLHRLHGLRRAQHCPTHCIPVASNVFGQRMDHIVRPQSERAGGDRGGETSNPQASSCACTMGNVGNRCNIRQAENRIGRRLNPDQAGFGRNSGLDVCPAGSYPRARPPPRAGAGKLRTSSAVPG